MPTDGIHLSDIAAKVLPPPSPIHSYTVKTGDTLSSIAGHYVHGDWEGLYWANRQVIGGNPNIITQGEKLQLKTEAGYKPPVISEATSVTVASVTKNTYHVTTHSTPAVVVESSSGTYSYSGLEALWVSAGGPASVEAAAATIAECESGGNAAAENPSGASGLWQILGTPFPGDPFDAATNARMAVAKFVGAGDSFAPWVCQA